MENLSFWPALRTPNHMGPRPLAAVFLSVALAALAAVPPGAVARGATASSGVPSLPGPLRRSRSVGLPWSGRLRHGVPLKPNKRVRYVTEYAAAGNFYGTWQLVQLLHRAAHRVALRLPGAKLSVGELSNKTGGNLSGHASHESGRDVDIGFYMLDGAKKPYQAYAFANFDGRGRALAPNRGLRFDVARNWELIAKLVADGDARVQYIFVSPPVRRLLLEEGKRRGAPPVVLHRATKVMVGPSANHPHANHFHVRIYCGPNERPGCTDQPPYWPWYPGKPPKLTSPL